MVQLKLLEVMMFFVRRKEGQIRRPVMVRLTKEKREVARRRNRLPQQWVLLLVLVILFSCKTRDSRLLRALMGCRLNDTAKLGVHVELRQGG
jgi:hypothetical protein